MGKSRKENLTNAKRNKNDEFYTQFDDIEKELKSYKKQLKNKVIYCNCDDAKHSNFWKYFIVYYNVLELKGLITTYWPKNENEKSYMLEINEEIINNLMKEHKLSRKELFDKFQSRKEEYFPKRKEIAGNDKYGAGDFRSQECIELLKRSDVVITNPPFSLFREYVKQLMDYQKKFLIIGNVNAINCKEIFPLLKNNKIWLGMNSIKEFIDVKNNNSIKKFGNVYWYTNLIHQKRNEELFLSYSYKGNEKNYPKYVNYDAINVDKTKEIPKDYFGVMGVPISIFLKYNPNQFEIVGLGKVGSCNFINNYKSEIYKNGERTGEFTNNCKGVLYYKYNSEINKNIQPKYRNVDNGDFYITPYGRVLIKRRDKVN